MGKFKRGHKTNLGRKRSEEFKKKMSRIMTGKKRPDILGNNNYFYGIHMTAKDNPNWRGDNIGLFGLHQRVRRYLPEPGLCQKCGLVAPYDLANITGIYTDDLENWQYWCRKCHLIDDGRINFFKNRWV